jgi:hypothetical protein
MIKSALRFAGGDIPKHHGVVLASRSQRLTVREKGHAPEKICVPLKRGLELAGMNIPQC